MKKYFLVMMFLFFIICVATSVDIKYITGTKNDAKVLKKAKPIYIVMDYKKTLMHETNMYEYFEKQNKEAGTEMYDVNRMIKDMKETLTEELVQYGKKWGLKLIEDKKEADGGYLLYIVLDRLAPVISIGYNSQCTINCYESDSDNLIFKAKLEVFTIGNGNNDRALKVAGEIIADRLIEFLTTL